MAQLPHYVKGVRAVGRDVYRGMWLLDRTRGDVYFFGLIVAPLVGVFILSPHTQYHFQAFQEPVPSLFMVDAVALEMGRDCTASDTENRPASGHYVQCSGFLRQPDGLMQRNQVHRGANLDFLGGLGDGRRHHEGRGHHRKTCVEVQFGQPDRVKPQLVGQLTLGDGVPVAGGRVLVNRARHLIEHAESH